ncbi:MAG: low specificity L-threonine aldolase [Rhizomicrobium sp.]|nr:low specificity L-threonine aldolase [Rhizomicrobium sp.]
MMNFLSDNAYGVLPEILAAVAAAGDGTAASYGSDELSHTLEARLAVVFETPVAAFAVISGTAANALALATLCPPHGAIFCHAEAHIAVDECAAPEFFTHGAKLVGIEGGDGKVTPEGLTRALSHFLKGFVHHPQPAVLSLSQPTECGTLYKPDEIAALAAIAHVNGMKVHMDGARFANAIVALGVSAADASWRAGVDVLSFGATKNGAMGAEAVVFFTPADASDFAYRRKKAGHLISKMRFVSAQLVAYLADDLWLRAARTANGLAAKLAGGLSKLPGVTVVHAVEANEVFLRLPSELVLKLRNGGAQFYDWGPPQGEQSVIRLVTSFATPPQDVERFVALANSE